MDKVNDQNVLNTMGLLSDCDVVLTNEDQQFIGLKYDQNFYASPVQICKGRSGINVYQRKVLDAMGIPCVENKDLVHALFDSSDEGNTIPISYWSEVAKIYATLPKFEHIKEDSDFDNELCEDVQAEIYSHEKEAYEKVLKKFEKLKPEEKKIEGNVAGYFEEEIRKMAAKYKLNTRSYHNNDLNTDEFCLEINLEKFDIQFRQMIFVAENEQKIFIGGRTFFMSYDFSQAQFAMKFLKQLVKTCNEKLKPQVQIYCNEYDINPKTYEIVSNSINALVEVNYKQTGQKYGFWYDTTRITIALKKSEHRMYLITLTYKEYLRDPEAFKEFLKNPQLKNDWNFWCHEEKFVPEYFEGN